MNDIVEIFLRIFVLMSVIVALSRVFGLRSFSKLSGFDFAVTVAIGSVLASGVTAPDTSLATFVAALCALFLWQMIVAPLRERFRLVEEAVDNGPLLVMRDGEVLDANLQRAGMTRSDLWAKLRDANVARIDTVQAAIVEATGVFTVIHGHEGGISPELLDGVRQ